MTLCYWAPAVEPELLERQVRHAFDRPVAVRLGSVHEFGNQDHTFYVEVLDTAPLDEARARASTTARSWSCPRPGTGPGTSPVSATGAPATWTSYVASPPSSPWIPSGSSSTIAYLELRGDRYEHLAEWHVTP